MESVVTVKLPNCRVAEALLSKVKSRALQNNIGHGTFNNMDKQVASAEATAECGLKIYVQSVAKDVGTDRSGFKRVYSDPSESKIEVVIPSACAACALCKGEPVLISY